MHIKKDLSFTGLRRKLSACFESLPEHRQAGKIKHSLHDVFMSGFAMMHFSASADSLRRTGPRLTSISKESGRSASPQQSEEHL